MEEDEVKVSLFRHVNLLNLTAWQYCSLKLTFCSDMVILLNKSFALTRRLVLKKTVFLPLASSRIFFACGLWDMVFS